MVKLGIVHLHLTIDEAMVIMLGQLWSIMVNEWLINGCDVSHVDF